MSHCLLPGSWLGDSVTDRDLPRKIEVSRNKQPQSESCAWPFFVPRYFWDYQRELVARQTFLDRTPESFLLTQRPVATRRKHEPDEPSAARPCFCVLPNLKAFEHLGNTIQRGVIAQPPEAGPGLVVFFILVIRWPWPSCTSRDRTPPSSISVGSTVPRQSPDRCGESLDRDCDGNALTGCPEFLPSL
jgi:hypothetical protein